MADLVLHDALNGVAVHPAPERRLEGAIEVRPLDALGARAAQRVARAALLHELRLPVRQVRLVTAAGAHAERGRGHDDRRQSRPDDVAGEAHRARTLSAREAGRGGRSSRRWAARITASGPPPRAVRLVRLEDRALIYPSRLMSARQRYRLRARSDREVILEAQPGITYVDQESGEELKVVGAVLPLAPSPSDLPYAVENLRLCGCSLEQLVQKDLNDCPHCGRRLPAVER
jgi:hypothetical protein